jgi:hypothetical protein
MKMDFIIQCLLKTDLELIGQYPKRIYIFFACYVFLLQEVWVIMFILVLIKSEGISCDNAKKFIFHVNLKCTGFFLICIRNQVDM